MGKAATTKWNRRARAAEQGDGKERARLYGLYGRNPKFQAALARVRREKQP